MMIFIKIINRYKTMPVQVRASFWFLLCGFLQKGIASITTPIFTRLMSTIEYGQYSVFSSWMSIITCFVTLNIYGGVFAQGIVKFEEKRKEFISAFQGLLLSLVTIWTILYLLFKDIINEFLTISTEQGFFMLILIWTTGVYQFWAKEQRTLYKYKALVVITLLYSVFMPVLSIIFIINSTDKVTARIMGIVIVSVLVYVWIFFLHIVRGKVFFSWSIWKHALGLSIPLIPHYLSAMILNSSDRIMIDKMVGSNQAGIYSLAYSVSLIMTIFNTSLLSTIEPWIYQKIKDKQYERISGVAYPCVITIAVVNLLLIILAPEVINIFAPVEYRDAIWVIPPVVMSVFFMFLYSFFAVFEFYFEKTGYITIATIIGAILNMVLNYIFIPTFGYVAAGYTTLFCYMLYALMHYYFMVKVCNKKMGGYKVYSIKILLGITVAFMSLGFCVLTTYNYIYIRLGIVVIVAIVCIVKRKKLKEYIELLLNVRRRQ